MSVHFHEEDIPGDVQFAEGAIAVDTEAMGLRPGRDRLCLKLYHFARFDVAIMRAYLGIMAGPVYCTRTASRLVRTYTDRHGLKELVKEMLGQDISKHQQTSDWGGPELSDAQRDYAASDVRYLHALKAKLDERLERENRVDLAQACFDFLPHRALLDLAGWEEQDIFAHV